MAEERSIGPFRHVAAGLTDVGRQRKHNEDHVLLVPEIGLYAVADGMGGHNAGDVASALTTHSLENFFLATEEEGAAADKPEGSDDDTEIDVDAHRIAAAVRKANHDVHEISTTVQQHHGMGSTVVAAYLPPESPRIHVAHVGDSRCYRIRNGVIRQLTNDHSLICDALSMKPDLTEDELSRLPKNIITRALGMRDVVPVDVGSDFVSPGDVYLLCSDGLSGMIEDEQMLEVISFAEDIAEACELLIAMANEAGGTDNISAVLIRIDEGDAKPRRVSDKAPVSKRDTTTRPEPQLRTITIPPERSELPPENEEGDDDDESGDDENADTIEQAPPAVLLSAEGSPIPIPIPMAFCNRCGFELFEGNLFCVECGSRIEAH